MGTGAGSSVGSAVGSEVGSTMTVVDASSVLVTAGPVVVCSSESSLEPTGVASRPQPSAAAVTPSP